MSEGLRPVFEALKGDSICGAHNLKCSAQLSCVLHQTADAICPKLIDAEPAIVRSRPIDKDRGICCKLVACRIRAERILVWTKWIPCSKAIVPPMGGKF